MARRMTRNNYLNNREKDWYTAVYEGYGVCMRGEGWCMESQFIRRGTTTSS